MSLPAGPAAQRKLAYYRRVRRRIKQDEKAFEIAGFTPGAPHDFGSQAAGVGSPNNLILPANARFAVSHSVGLSPEWASFEDIGPPTIGYWNAETTGANGIQEVRNWFEKDTELHIFRALGSTAGTLSIYFLGPHNKRTLIATATWT